MLRPLGYTAGLPQFLGNPRAFSHLETNSVDSGIGAAATELGLAGLLIYLFVILALATCPLRSWQRLPDGPLKEPVLVPVVLALAFAMTSVVAVMAAALPFSIYFWALVGMALKAPLLLKRSPDESTARLHRFPADRRGHPDDAGQPHAAAHPVGTGRDRAVRPAGARI